MSNIINNKSLFTVDDEQPHQAGEDFYNDGAPIFDVYDDEEPSMAVLAAAMKKEYFTLLGEIHEEVKKMVHYWEDRASTWSMKMKTLKKPHQPAKQIVEVKADLQVPEESQQTIKRSTTLPPRCRQDRPVPVRRHHPTPQARKPRKLSRSNLSKPRFGFSSTKSPQHAKPPRFPYLQWRFQISTHILLSFAEEVLSLAGRIGTNGKRPFDRGRAKLVRERERDDGSYHPFSFIRLEDSVCTSL
uniref:Uncharacterized protein n=1 Tax=Noccaea caerulescens TaxID=107243 RepID=A0A1J3FB73_NOCCA